MGFHEIRFPTALSFGASGGPERLTEIVNLVSGFEERSSPWQHGRRRYDAGLGMQSLADIETLIAFFEARMGRLFGFRFKDWTDYKSCSLKNNPSILDQSLGQGDGERRAFQLQKRYRSGPACYDRPIRKPVPGSVKIALDGGVLAPERDYQIDETLGAVVFHDAPPKGSGVTAGFEFDVPVRFDTDSLQISMASYQAGQVPSIPIIEVRI